MLNPFGKLRNDARPQRLAARILLPVLFIFLLILTGFFLYSYLTDRNENEAQAQRNSQQAEQSFNTEIRRLSDFALGLALQAATNPRIQEEFGTRDRQALQNLTLPGYLALDAEFGIPQYQYHLPPATSFLRLHNTNSFGDDLSTFRFTVLQVNATQQPVSGLEMGRGGLGLRGIEPVFYNGKHVGSVEFGLNIDETFVNNLKTSYGNEWRILVTRESLSLATLEDIEALREGPTPDLLILASTQEGISPDVTAYERVLNGETTISTVASQGRTYSIVTFPLRDFENKIIGTVETAFDVTATVQAQTAAFVYFSGALLLVLAVGALILTFFTNRALQPLTTLAEAANAIQRGDLSRQVTISTRDEIGTLAGAFNNMTSQLRNLIDSLEQRVADRTKALQTSIEVTRRLTIATTPHQLAVDVVEQMRSAFHYYHAHIYFVDEASGDLLMAGGTGEVGATLLERGHKVSKGRGLVGRAAETNTPILIPDVSIEPGWLPNPLLPDTKCEVSIPISLGKRVLGVLDVQQNEVNSLGEEDVELLQSIAGQVAISLQNTRIYEEFRVRAEVESLANTIGQKIQRTTSIEETLQTAIRELGMAVGAQRVKASLGQANEKTPVGEL